MKSRPVQSLHPYSQSIHYQVDFCSNEQVEELLTTAEKAFLLHRNTPLAIRVKFLLQLQMLLEKDKKKLAELITLEMGKPLLEAISEIEKCAHLCGFYAENGAT